MRGPFAAPTAEEQSELLQEIGPVPLQGPAWPAWVKLIAWFVVVLLGVQIARVWSMESDAVTGSTIGLAVLFCFIGLAIVAFYMQRSITTIDERGIRQTWIMKRDVPWEDVQFAKFVPLLFSKRLVIFTRRGRPLIFQGGTRALHIAFARISLVYRRRS